MTTQKPGKAQIAELSESELEQISGGPDRQLCYVCTHSSEDTGRAEPGSKSEQYLLYEDYDNSP